MTNEQALVAPQSQTVALLMAYNCQLLCKLLKLSAAAAHDVAHSGTEVLPTCNLMLLRGIYILDVHAFFLIMSHSVVCGLDAAVYLSRFCHMYSS